MKPMSLDQRKWERTVEAQPVPGAHKVSCSVSTVLGSRCPSKKQRECMGERREQ